MQVPRIYNCCQRSESRLHPEPIRENHLLGYKKLGSVQRASAAQRGAKRRRAAVRWRGVPLHGAARLGTARRGAV